MIAGSSQVITLGEGEGGHAKAIFRRIALSELFELHYPMIQFLINCTNVCLGSHALRTKNIHCT